MFFHHGNTIIMYNGYMIKNKAYICIDLKSFYASVECVERGLDPLDTNLVVADSSRTNKTICLAVSPSLKGFGISSRPRLFEVEQKVREINRQRRLRARGHEFAGKSTSFRVLHADKNTELDYVVAVPRMNYYMKYSSDIYKVYLKYVAPEDIHVYSIDEVFIDATAYLNTYKMTAHELCMTMIRDVLKTTGVTATGGIGTNMYLAKVAMDVIAKKMPADEDGVRIAELDEYSYRRQMWDHQPITDVWRIGRGMARRLAEYGLHTMGDVAMFSLDHQEQLFKEFGVNAELLIDHAWGREPTEMKYIKSYKPQSKSISSGQVLSRPYRNDEGRIIATEMADALSLDLADKKITARGLGLYVAYDITNLNDSNFSGQLETDFYGRTAPRPAKGSVTLPLHTNATSMIVKAIQGIYDKVVNPNLTIRRVNLVAYDLLDEQDVGYEPVYRQGSLFDQGEEAPEFSRHDMEKEHRLQDTINQINKKYGRNSVYKGVNRRKGATGLERNKQVGGHRG